MARNGSGTYTAPNTFVSGNTITAAGHNQNWTDVASEMTNSVAADGQTTMTGPLKGVNGTAAAPTHTFASDTNTGTYRHGADELGFSVGGVLAGWFDSAKKLWAIGAVDVAGAFSVTGLSTFTGAATFNGAGSFTTTLGVTGNFAVNTNKFTVTASNGNTLVAGTFDATGAGVFASTLSATGNFAINTNKFNVTAASGNTAIAGTLAVTGASTLTGAVTAASSVLSSSATAGIGYATGAGNAVTQLTSKSTGVTLNNVCGQITTNNSALGSGSATRFTFTNSAIAATDTVSICINSGATAGFYIVTAESVVAGSCLINMYNYGVSSKSEALVLNFVVIKGVAS